MCQDYCSDCLSEKVENDFSVQCRTALIQSVSNGVISYETLLGEPDSREIAMEREVSLCVQPDYDIKLYNKEGFIQTFGKVPTELEALGKPEKMMLNDVLQEVWRIRHGAT